MYKVTYVVVLKCLFHYHHFVGSLAPPFLLCLFSQDYLKKNNFYICCNLFLADPLKINVMTILRKDKRACSYRISFGTALVAIRHLYATTLLIRYFFNVLVCMQFSCYPINNENTKIIFRDMWNVLIHLLYIRFELSRSHQVQWMYLQNCLQTFHKRNVSKKTNVGLSNDIRVMDFAALIRFSVKVSVIILDIFEADNKTFICGWMYCLTPYLIQK